MTTTPNVSEWRAPQLIRDRKPYRPGFPEAVTKVERNVAVALLLAKLHSELYEIEMEPGSAEEVADFLTVLHSLHDLISSSWTRGDPETKPHILATPLPAFITTANQVRDGMQRETRGYAPIHTLIERLGRDLLNRNAVADIVDALACATEANGIAVDQVIEKFRTKMASVGGFDGHLLWQSTEF
jgi:predicted house-cleaning noncanonical NTP pyrophosphatase (MazG superfamily)|nr:hypothetical protein [Neorhizobium tomejilense]